MNIPNATKPNTPKQSSSTTGSNCTSILGAMIAASAEAPCNVDISEILTLTATKKGEATPLSGNTTKTKEKHTGSDRIKEGGNTKQKLFTSSPESANERRETPVSVVEGEMRFSHGSLLRSTILMIYFNKGMTVMETYLMQFKRLEIHMWKHQLELGPK